MREIKFRAWDKKERCFVNSIFWTLTAEGKPIQDGAYKGDTQDFVLMQYTGLKDKNGKEIYEGDIVTNGGIKAEVKYAVGRTGFVLRADKGYMLGPLTNWENIQVIGNIYENPELVA